VQWRVRRSLQLKLIEDRNNPRPHMRTGHRPSLVARIPFQKLFQRGIFCGFRNRTRADAVVPFANGHFIPTFF
jgi:hypothetical protein